MESIRIKVWHILVFYSLLSVGSTMLFSIRSDEEAIISVQCLGCKLICEKLKELYLMQTAVLCK